MKDLTSPSAASRFDAIDILRGLVIALMTIDHSSGAFNSGRFMQDAVWMWKPGSPLPFDQFLVRWVTHLCAPTFVFLAGTSIALSSRARSQRGESERSIDIALCKRGAFIAMVDPLWMSLAFLAYSGIIFQVMYALGTSMMLMAALRKVSPRVLFVGALAFSGLSEVAVGLATGGGDPSVVAALFVSGGKFPMSIGPLHIWIVAYPILPWLTIMVFGYVFGRMLLDSADLQALPRKIALTGLALLSTFVAVRGLNGYGNMHLMRENADALQWLHVSKYPPSLTYVTLELGIAALLLSLFWSRPSGAWNPLRTLGQTSLFFYLLHAHLLEAVALLLGVAHKAGIGATLLAALLTIVALYPLCVRYAAYKKKHPNGLARYV